MSRLSRLKELAYRVGDVLTFGRGVPRHISGQILRIPLRYFRYFPADYELNNINFIHNYVHRDMTVVDVGAHIGLMSVILSQKVGPGGKVFAFEPTPSTFAILTKTLAINGATGRVTPVQQAFSSHLGCYLSAFSSKWRKWA